MVSEFIKKGAQNDQVSVLCEINENLVFIAGFLKHNNTLLKEIAENTRWLRVKFSS